MTNPVDRTFLTAEWRDLAMLNFVIDPALLGEYLPYGCELDSWSGRTYVSVVGFRFLRTRVRGLPIPFHRNFEEVNLRFYVRRRADQGWKRGVVFIKELVPRRAIAWVARRVYAENYAALPMRHRLETADRERELAYEWRRDGTWEGLSARYSGEPMLPGDDTEESFISEHYWGYAPQPDGGTIEYRVEHPRWNVWRAHDARLECDVAALWHASFAEALAAPPSTAFVADGSAVIVRRGRRLP